MAASGEDCWGFCCMTLLGLHCSVDPVVQHAVGQQAGCSLTDWAVPGIYSVATGVKAALLLQTHRTCTPRHAGSCLHGITAVASSFLSHPLLIVFCFQAC